MGPSASGRVKIEINLANYFAGVFGDDPADIMPATNIPKTYSISPEAWALYADTINGLSWMGRLDVKLKRTEMQTVPTISQMASLIAGRAKSSMSMLSQMLEFSPLRSRLKAKSFVRPRSEATRIRRSAKRKSPV